MWIYKLILNSSQLLSCAEWKKQFLLVQYFFMVPFLKFFWKLDVRMKAESLQIGLDAVGHEYW